MKVRTNAAEKQRERTMEMNRLADRTPCPRCAVRADIGCQHSQKEAA